MSATRTQKHILIVDDEQAVCWVLQRALTRQGHTATVASSAEDAFAAAAEQPPDVIILDIRLPGVDGLTALSRFREQNAVAAIIIITAFGNLSTAIKAVQGGAFEYLTKPFDLQLALEVVERALQRHPTLENQEVSPGSVDTQEIVGGSAPMQTVFKRIALVARANASVLITGESGTGKELVARAIHRHSSRGAQPFLPVHVAALNQGLLESELFGHVKGAFTGAVQQRPGLLALANGGTVFLDELADIPLSAQVKLLRVLEHGEVYPVGSNQPQLLDVRILAATHQDLRRRVEEGAFRHDLFFRLNVFQVHLPPLRERTDDIPLLVRHFLGRMGRTNTTVSEETLRYLLDQSWPGNVRELAHALEHALILAQDGPILPIHFPAPVPLGPWSADELTSALRNWLDHRLGGDSASPPTGLHQELLRLVEATVLADLMQRVHGNRWQAARILGLNRATVRKKLAEYDLGAADTSPDDDEIQ